MSDEQTVVPEVEPVVEPVAPEVVSNEPVVAPEAPVEPVEPALTPEQQADLDARQARTELLKAAVQEALEIIFTKDFTMAELEGTVEMFTTWFRLRVLGTDQHKAFMKITNDAAAVFSKTLAKDLTVTNEQAPETIKA